LLGLHGQPSRAASPPVPAVVEVAVANAVTKGHIELAVRLLEDAIATHPYDDGL
jgi:hypothetical protein